MDKTAGQADAAERERTSTVVAADMVIRGDIEGPSDLHLHGRIVGKVAVIGLLVDATAVIEGPVTAEAVAVSGHVIGSIDARVVHLKPTARVEGDITYESLQIEAGARLSGRCAFLEGGKQNVVPFSEPPAAKKPEDPSELADSSQELVRLAARLRRSAE